MIKNINDIIVNKEKIEHGSSSDTSSDSSSDTSSDISSDSSSDTSSDISSDTSSDTSSVFKKYILTNQHDKSFGTEVAENDIEELFLNNEKKRKNKILIDKLIQINKMKRVNEYLEDVIKDYQNEYDTLINNYKNKYKCLNVLIKHLNKLEKNKNITKSLKKELKEEKEILMSDLLDVKNILEQLTI